ncbi:DUF6250 domain-containing protein [Pontiellaceae bacterium B12227]|nr:DUF6250 domain-containing protein [Pontiellaceae bacterium B12227]
MDIMKTMALGALVGVVAGCETGKPQADVEPWVLGYGEEAFTVGELLYLTDFSDAENWVQQMSENVESDLKANVKMGDGMMDLYMPAMGCTAWLKKKFEGPISIIYQARCPLETIDGKNIIATDMNNFWHCSDPRKFDAVLNETDSHYNGDFVSYHEMHGYYASTGGGYNTTTRFRRYPRWIDGKDIPHVALNDQDGNPEHLLKPGEWHTIQLVACDGLTQYIQDGKVVYETKYGDTIVSEDRRNKESPRSEVVYTRAAYPAFTSGYFGFRLVRTHHQYRNLKVYQLNPK